MKYKIPKIWNQFLFYPSFFKIKNEKVVNTILFLDISLPNKAKENK